MTRERFQILAQAYGGEIARWPADAREAAAELVAADPEWTAAVLAEAARLDGMLRQAPAPAPSSALVGRVIAAAQDVRRRIAWWLPVGLGAGLAAASAAGLIVGVQLSHTVIENQAVATAIADDDASVLIDEAA
jgi:hypothetical protein